MNIINIFKVNQADRNKFCTHVIESSAPRVDFYFLVILSTLIVSLGLLSDNVVLVIGGMLVAPLLSPILALSLGVVISDVKVIMRSIRILFMSFVFAFLVAFILGLFTRVNLHEISLISKMEPTLLVFFISIVAGIAASYTWVKPSLNETLPGIAITVTLIPPLTTIGLAIADRQWLIFDNVLKVFLLNVFGIIVSTLVLFSLMNFYTCKKKVAAVVEEEEKELKKENNK